MLIDCVAELLQDGKWHHVRSIARELGQPEGKIREILKFCADFNFVVLDEAGSRVKIDERFKRFLDLVRPADLPVRGP